MNTEPPRIVIYSDAARSLEIVRILVGERDGVAAYVVIKHDACLRSAG